MGIVLLAAVRLILRLPAYRGLLPAGTGGAQPGSRVGRRVTGNLWFTDRWYRRLYRYFCLYTEVGCLRGMLTYRGRLATQPAGPYRVCMLSLSGPQAPIPFIIQPRPGLSRERAWQPDGTAATAPNRRRLPPANPPVAGCSGGAAIKKRRVGPASRLTHAAPFHADVVTVLRGSAAASLGRLLPCPQRVKKCYSQRHADRIA